MSFSSRPSAISSIGLGSGFGGWFGVAFALIWDVDVPLGLVIGAAVGVVIGLLIDAIRGPRSLRPRGSGDRRGWRSRIGCSDASPEGSKEE
jgi:hypothetical protein